MANSRQGQYQLEFNLDGWTAPSRSHALRLNCQAVGSPSAGDDAGSVSIQQRGGGSVSLAVAANQAWSYLRLMYANSISCSSYTLWYWSTNTARDFISTGLTSAPAGGGVGITVAGQATLTFRGALGGLTKLVFIESVWGGDARSALISNPTGNTPQRIAAYAVSADSIITCLDNSFVVAPIRVAAGQNEAVWRKINRA